jgi:hypothetical protein
MTEPRLQTRPILGGIYGPMHSRRGMLTHTVTLPDGIPLCSVKPTSVADAGSLCGDEGERPPTCKTCLRRDPRFAPTPPETR